MFNSNRKNQAPAVNAATTSLIARGVTVNGDVQFTGTLHLDGTIEGSVQADPAGSSVLTISETGRVVGRIEVPHAVINGCVSGDVEVSERLELAQLARIEAEIAIATLLRRLPELKLDDAENPEWRPTFVLRGLKRLPASW